MKPLNKCYFCHNTWGHCSCSPLEKGHGFTCDGIEILEPMVDETGRFFVDPVKYYGDPYVKWVAENFLIKG